MNLTTKPKWCVILCHIDFTVKGILHEHNMDLPLKENDALVSLVDPIYLDKYFNFVLDMQQRKSMFLQELNIIDAKGQSHLLDISCIRYEGHYLLMGVSKEMAFQDDLLAINQDLTRTLRSTMKEITPNELKDMLESGDQLNLVDVRESDEVAEGMIPGAVHIPLGDVEARMDELDKSKQYIVICRSGGRSGRATEFLDGSGYNVVNMTGGMLAWEGVTE